MKKMVAVAAAVACASLALVSCGKKEAGASAKAGADANNKIVVWSFTDELDGMIKNYFEKDARFAGKYEITYSLTPTDQFPNKLDPVLASGAGCPDVFALEDAFVRKYVESGLLLDLTDVYNEIKSDMVPYPVEVGSANGKVYALSWQVTPGALFYRRSLAKKYLGTDDPAEVQKYLCNWEKFLETAQLLKDKSNGACYILSSTGDLFKPYSAGRKDPWVVNGKLTVDPLMEDYMDMCKTLHDKGFEGRVGQWSEGWFAGMKGEFKDEAGNDKEVFSYLLPTWGLHYVLKTNAPDTTGDWAMCAGPVGYRWGGTWVGAWAKTKNPNAAKTLIKYVATDYDFLKAWAENTGDVVSNSKVVADVKDNFSEPFLGGQNHYAEFAEMSKTVNGKLSQGTDQAVEGLFGEATAAYVNGEKSKAKALEDFKAQVAAQLSLSY
ncbi:MAG: ABC transporter substrate-binding protein [Treponema sp.]|nr:ABC transporter substrate-binding protein [Treponema sp.]